MSVTSKRKLTVLLCSLLVLVFLLGSCTVAEDSGESKKLCKEFVDYALADDRASAYDMVKNIASEEDFNALWQYVRAIFKDSKSYELKQTYWNKSLDDGVSTTTVTFEMVTDDEKICMIYIVTMPQVEGIAGIHFTDVTEFAEKTKGLDTVNLVLTVISLIAFGFIVWMFVDCMKRSIKRKVLWAIIICVELAFSITYGPQNLSFNWWFGTPTASSGIVANLSNLSITLTLAIPLGAIIYFFVRKKLPLKESVQNTEAADLNDAPASETNTESTAETETNTVENTENENK